MELSNVTINKQSSIRMEYNEGVVYFDPIEITEELHDADVIFVTHDHFDHFSVDTIHNLVKEDTVIVVPKKMEKAVFGDAVLSKLTVQLVEPNQNVELASGLCFETIPAYNTLKPFHMKAAGWCGYVVTIEGKRYYVSGDTDDNKDIRKVNCDVALIPIGGTYTMNVKQAAEYINALKPATVIPTHYGEIVGSVEDGNTFKGLVDQGVEVVLKL